MSLHDWAEVRKEAFGISPRDREVVDIWVNRAREESSDMRVVAMAGDLDPDFLRRPGGTVAAVYFAWYDGEHSTSKHRCGWYAADKFGGHLKTNRVDCPDFNDDVPPIDFGPYLDVCRELGYEFPAERLDCPLKAEA